MAKISKPKLLKNNGKTPMSGSKLGASASSKNPSPLMTMMGKKNYKKKQSQIETAMPSFGMTGMTGET